MGILDITSDGVLDLPQVHSDALASRISRVVPSKAFLALDSAAPPAPKIIRNSANTSAVFYFSWEPVQDTRVVGYNIYRAERKTHTHTAERLQFIPQPPDYKRGGLITFQDPKPGARFRYYFVAAVNAAGMESARSAATRAYSDTDLPSEPRSVTAIADDVDPAVSGKEIVVRWEKPAINAEMVTAYLIELNDNENFPDHTQLHTSNFGEVVKDSNELTDVTCTFTPDWVGKTVFLYNEQIDGKHVIASGIIESCTAHSIKLNKPIPIGGIKIPYEIVVPSWEQVLRSASLPALSVTEADSLIPAQQGYSWVVKGLALGSYYVRAMAICPNGFSDFSSPAFGPVELDGLKEGDFDTDLTDKIVSSVNFAVVQGLWEDNTPSAGYVAWEDFKVSYRNNIYTIADGATDKKWIYWDMDNPNVFTGTDDLLAFSEHQMAICMNVDGFHYTQYNPVPRLSGTQFLDGSIPGGKFATDLSVPKIVTTLPVAGTKQGEAVYLTTAKQLYWWTGTRWSNEVPTSALYGTIDTSKLEGTISASKIVGGTLDAGLINVQNLSAGAISTGTLSASFISGGILNAALISVVNLSASSITTGTLDASLIKAGTLDCGLINVSNLSASAIVTGTLDADRISTGSIEIRHLNENVLVSLDPQTAHFSTSSFIQDGSIHTLNLSSIVPEGYRVVVLRFSGQCNGTGLRHFAVRRSGQLYNTNQSLLTFNSPQDWAGMTGDLITMMDSSRRIEYWCTSNGFRQISLTVAIYMF